jgi:hypothetical protein
MLLIVQMLTSGVTSFGRQFKKLCWLDLQSLCQSTDDLKAGENAPFSI